MKDKLDYITDFIILTNQILIMEKNKEKKNI